MIELTSLFFAVSESRSLADLSWAHRLLPGNYGYAVLAYTEGQASGTGIGTGPALFSPTS